MTAPLLSIDDLHVQFTTDVGVVRAVDGVSYDIRAGETLAVVGESGSGKSVTAMAILGLTRSQRGEIPKGRIEFEGEDLVHAEENRLRQIRGNDIAMIFQEPMTSLNPVYTVGTQIGEPLILHRRLDEDQARVETIRLLELVGIAAPERRIDEYPHQLSGGMRQRVMIAMALACRPKLLIADEPTTALDVTIQAQILDLLAELQQELGIAILLITHDLGVVAQVAHRAVVMYGGRVVERGTVEELFFRPKHPYTAGLLHSIPKVGGNQTRLHPIDGNVPNALNFPKGCRFHPRCPHRLPECDQKMPQFSSFPGEGHVAACFRTEQSPGLDLLRPVDKPQGGEA
jgi:oligopeptide/dipeptide ABC transporter ATP-binding protein